MTVVDIESDTKYLVEDACAEECGCQEIQDLEYILLHELVSRQALGPVTYVNRPECCYIYAPRPLLRANQPRKPLLAEIQPEIYRYVQVIRIQGRLRRGGLTPALPLRMPEITEDVGKSRP